MAELLFEIYTEEIPAGYIEPALEQVKQAFSKGTSEAFENNFQSWTFATPRRLVLYSTGEFADQPDREVEVLGPPENACFKDGKPTKALTGFASKMGVAPDQIEFVDAGKVKKAQVKKLEKGRTAKEILAELLPSIIDGLSFPKSMRWVPGSPKTFARPVRSILALLDGEVIDFEWNGVKSGNISYGHPFHCSGGFEVEKQKSNQSWIDCFLKILDKKGVILSSESRSGYLKEKINIKEIVKLEYRDEIVKLIDEVSYLVEWPAAIEGTFDERFLELPDCVITTAMMSHQRYFPVHDADGKLINKFICFANRDVKPGDESYDLIKKGNERVLRARLEDAAFFFEKDRAAGLEKYAKEMDGVIYHRSLGTFGQKAERMAALGAFIAERLDLDAEAIERVKNAARLSKADLATEMVGEFPSLQGVIGSEYARAEGVDEETARTVAEHYMPAGADAALPETAAGSVLALADKFDNLAGFFAAGHAPTGRKDAFGLRRAAIGIISIILNKNFHLDLHEIFDKAIDSLRDNGLSEPAPADLPGQLLDFMKDRVKVMFKDGYTTGHKDSPSSGFNYSHDLIDAAVETGFEDIRDLHERLRVLNILSKEEPLWPELVEIVERTFNISKKHTAAGQPHEDLLSEDAEIELFQVFDALAPEFATLVESGEYEKAARLYHEKLKYPVHKFFDKVYVNVDDEKVKHNRLALVRSVNLLFTDSIADLKLVVIPGRES